jgi:hypothetical protein
LKERFSSCFLFLFEQTPVALVATAGMSEPIAPFVRAVAGT